MNDYTFQSNMSEEKQELNESETESDVSKSSFRNVTSSRKNHLQTLFKARRQCLALLKQDTHREGMSFGDVGDSLSSDEETEDVQHLECVAESNDVKPMSGPLLEIMIKLKDYQPVLNRMRKLNIPVEVRIRNLTYTVQVNQNMRLETVFSTSMFYRVYKWYKGMVSGMKDNSPNMVSKRVLDDISLELKPGKMYLVLGPPASGKTTLMRCIAGLLHPHAGERLEGAVTYNGREMKVSR